MLTAWGALAFGSVYPREAILSFDSFKPDGTPRKLLDVSKLHQLGWQHRMALGDGIADTYEWFVQRQVEPAATGRI